MKNNKTKVKAKLEENSEVDLHQYIIDLERTFEERGKSTQLSRAKKLKRNRD